MRPSLLKENKTPGARLNIPSHLNDECVGLKVDRLYD